MGKRGPKPKSAILESLQGFPGRRKKATQAKLAALEKAHDSPNVPANSPPNSALNAPPEAPPSVPRELPAILTTKRERAIWQEITTCPVRSGWFRSADMALIARHVSKLARLEAMMRRRIPATYKTRTGAGERIIRANPEYRAMMQLDREVRAEEQLLAGNPVARLTLESKTGEVHDLVRPALTPPADGAAAARHDQHAGATSLPDGRTLPPAPPSPLGILKSAKVSTH